MQTLPQPFSYSRLTTFEQCPKKFHAINIAKTAPMESNEILDYGKEVHDAFANFLKHGKDLPLHLKQYQKHLEPLRKAIGEKIVEQKLAVNPSFEPTGWMDRDVYCRVISDFTLLNKTKGLIWDHKTGKVYDDFTQLKLTALVMFMMVPELEEIVMAYFWTKTRQVTKETMTRAQVAEVWATFVPRLERYQHAFDHQEFPPKPNPYCRGCVVNKCQYFEKRK